jgi:ethanolamine utilization cobalamin adenosyltransferase
LRAQLLADPETVKGEFMRFLTEDDIRARCPNPDCSLLLTDDERLTPAAAELAARMRVNVARQETGEAAPRTDEPADDPAGAENRQALTWLDASTMAPKSHPRILLRGKLDTLLAEMVLAQTRFDTENRLVPYLKDCLADAAAWVLGVLSAEVSGEPCPQGAMGGMDAAVLHAVSRNPEKHLGLAPCIPGAAMGAEAALINRLRALTRETEVAAVQSGLARADIAASLNRLSSALYVLALLIMAAEKGMDIAAPGRK